MKIYSLCVHTSREHMMYSCTDTLAHVRANSDVRNEHECAVSSDGLMNDVNFGICRSVTGIDFKRKATTIYEDSDRYHRSAVLRSCKACDLNRLVRCSRLWRMHRVVTCCKCCHARDKIHRPGLLRHAGPRSHLTLYDKSLRPSRFKVRSIFGHTKVD